MINLKERSKSNAALSENFWGLNFFAKNAWLRLFLFSFFLSLVYAKVVLHAFPNSADEYVYIFQAETYAALRLWNEVHPLQKFFEFIHIFSFDGKWVGRFPPGWPITLTPWTVLNQEPWYVNPALSASSVVIFFTIARKLHGIRVALIASLTFSTSAFYLLNSGSFFSHPLALLQSLIFFYFGLLFLEKGNRFYLFLAGFFLGFLFITRPATAALLGTTFLVFLQLKSPLQKNLSFAYFLVGLSPFLIGIAIYNFAITGNAFQMVTQWHHPHERLGFVNGHGLIQLITHTLRRIIDLTIWALPTIFVLLYQSIKILKNKKHLDGDDQYIVLEISLFVAVAVGYGFYYGYGGNQYGPRFWYECYPFLLLAVTAITFRGSAKSVVNGRGQRIYFFGFFIQILLVFPITIFFYLAIGQRMDLFSQAENLRLKEAVIFVRDGTGYLKGMPVQDLLRNNISIDNDPIYVRDFGYEESTSLMKFFPGRSAWLYRKSRNDTKGKLVPYLN